MKTNKPYTVAGVVFGVIFVGFLGAVSFWSESRATGEVPAANPTAAVKPVAAAEPKPEVPVTAEAAVLAEPVAAENVVAEPVEEPQWQSLVDQLLAQTVSAQAESVQMPITIPSDTYSGVPGAIPSGSSGAASGGASGNGGLDLSGGSSGGGSGSGGPAAGGEAAAAEPAVTTPQTSTSTGSTGGGGSSSPYDVQNVLFQGDSTLMGMDIESSYFQDGAFLVETTGARFQYVEGELKVFQGLDPLNRRLISSLIFDGRPAFRRIESNSDHVLYWSEQINLGIYGDSTLIVYPKIRQQLLVKGNFTPDYEGRVKGELFLVDDEGGMQVYPQRHETGYTVTRIELGKNNWTANYQLQAQNKVMITVFPGRPFNWEESFNSNLMFVHSIPTQLNSMVNSGIIKNEWARLFDVIVMWHRGLYRENKNGTWAGPYVISEPTTISRFLQTTHSSGLKTIAYCSYVYHYETFRNPELFFNEIKSLKDNYHFDGVYIDGMRFDIGLKAMEDKINNWEMIRRLRQLFGANGYLMVHDTHLGTPVSTNASVDAYCNSVLNGENVEFQSLNDPYVQYHVRKYSITNTIGFWKPGPHPDSISDQNIIDAILDMNGRERYWFESSFDDYLRQRTFQPTPLYQYYREQLELLRIHHSSTSP